MPVFSWKTLHGRAPREQASAREPLTCYRHEQCSFSSLPLFFSLPAIVFSVWKKKCAAKGSGHLQTCVRSPLCEIRFILKIPKEEKHETLRELIKESLFLQNSLQQLPA